MKSTASDIMRTRVLVVGPDLTLPELERLFITNQISGCPVTDRGELLGIVSRTDIIRQLCIERARAGVVSDYYHDETGVHSEPLESFEEVATRVGKQIEGLRVMDIMIRDLITVRPDEPLDDVARLLVQHHIHRVPVAEDRQLVGIVTAMDLVRLFAEREVKAI